MGAELDDWEPVSDREVLIWTAAIIDLVAGDHDGSISPCGHDGIRLGGGTGGGEIGRIVSIRLLSERRTAELDPGAQVATTKLARA